MPDQTIILFTALPALSGAGAEATPPAWMQLVPAGTFTAADGRGPWKLTDAAAVIAASMAGGNLPVDVNHATDFAMKTGGDAPAHGWIVEMASRADGIWGRVEWNPSGLQLLTNKSYRGVSPVITVDKAGRVLKILRAALTNTPALTALATLLTTQKDQTVQIEQIRAALKLPDTADEATVLATLTERGTVVDLVARAAAAAGVAATTPEALVIALTAQRATMVPNETVVALQAQVNALTAARAGDAATAFIDAAIKAGKPIVASRDSLIALHAQDAAMVEKLVNGMPTLNTTGNGGPIQIVALAATDDGDALDETEMATCKKMSLDPKQFAKTKKKMRESKMEAA